MRAAFKGHDDVVAQLIAAGADVDQTVCQGQPALMEAAFQGHDGVVSQLLAAGADIHIQNKDGKTALALSLHDKRIALALNEAQKTHEEVIRAIIKNVPLIDEQKEYLFMRPFLLNTSVPTGLISRKKIYELLKDYSFMGPDPVKVSNPFSDGDS